MKKKMICWMLLMTVAALLPALAMAEGAAGAAASAPAIDWTALVVAVIGVIGTAASALLGRVWVKYVKPWLAQRDLTDAAKIVVEAVEALLGRYCGEDKWKLALQKMADRGFYTESQEVIDALKAAWKQLDMAMIAAGENDAGPCPDDPKRNGARQPVRRCHYRSALCLRRCYAKWHICQNINEVHKQQARELPLSRL